VQTGSALLPRRYNRPSLFDSGYNAVMPFQWLRQMEREMDRMFTSFFEGPIAQVGELAASANWVPTVDVRETEDHWILHIELPGIKPEDVEVTTTGNVLTVNAESKYEQEKPQQGSDRSARSYRSFRQSFPLPPTVQTEAVTAEYQNGVLLIHLPKTEDSKQRYRRIPVGTGSSPAIEGQLNQEALSGSKGGEVSSPEAAPAKKSRRSKKSG